MEHRTLVGNKDTYEDILAGQVQKRNKSTEGVQGGNGAYWNILYG